MNLQYIERASTASSPCNSALAQNIDKAPIHRASLAWNLVPDISSASEQGRAQRSPHHLPYDAAHEQPERELNGGGGDYLTIVRDSNAPDWQVATKIQEAIACYGL